MPKHPKKPVIDGTKTDLPEALLPKKPGFDPGQASPPKGLKGRPGGGKGGKPPRFPGRAGGR